MERITLNVKDAETKSVLEHIFENAFGLPIIFTATPTNAAMKANTWGFYSNVLYVKFANNVVLKFTGTVVS